MQYTTLESVSPEVLYTAFIEAFSDYQIPVRMSQEQFEETNDQRSVNLADSFGAFSEDGELIGFILCGVRKIGRSLSYYDGATAILPSFRGKGVGSGLLEHALSHARSAGAASFFLEVIQDNESAFHLYESRGFVKTRILRCFEKQRELFSEITDDRDEFKNLSFEEWQACTASVSLPYAPSWQNDSLSIHEIFGSLTVRALKRDGRWVGYYVLYPGKGDVMALGAKQNDPEIWKALLEDAATQSSSDKLVMINIEEDSPLCAFLESSHWESMVDQWEMKASL